MILSGSKAFLSFLAVATGAVSAAVEPVPYTDGELELAGYKSIPESLAEGEKLPAVVILPVRASGTVVVVSVPDSVGRPILFYKMRCWGIRRHRILCAAA